MAKRTNLRNAHGADYVFIGIPYLVLAGENILMIRGRRREYKILSAVF
jgi:hypothetical protein